MLFITLSFSISFQASDKEIIWVMRIALIVIGVVAVFMALAVKSVLFLFFLCVDLVYVILFPQLCCVLFVDVSNAYGALVGYFLAVLLRFGGGDPSLGVAPFIEYPFYAPGEGQLFPFRTLAMLVGLIATICTSYLTKTLFEKRIIPRSMDVLRCFGPENANEGGAIHFVNTGSPQKNFESAV